MEDKTNTELVEDLRKCITDKNEVEKLIVRCKNSITMVKVLTHYRC